jgi:hypothetical protein
VSTTHQTIENQRRELEAITQRHDWDVIVTFVSAGISGTKGVTGGLAPITYARASPDASSIWSRPGRLIAWADRCSSWWGFSARVSISTCISK